MEHLIQLSPIFAIFYSIHLHSHFPIALLPHVYLKEEVLYQRSKKEKIRTFICATGIQRLYANRRFEQNDYFKRYEQN